MSALVLANTTSKQAWQNRREFENASRGLGISKHFWPFSMERLHPRQEHCFPAIAILGTPAEPLINEGILFLDILELFDLPR